MNESLEQKIAAAMRQPQNVGELQDADAVGTTGDSECGEMLRMWIKYRQENGKKVIDRATFQSFGCETAIAVASLATELIKGKTPEEALALKSEELAGELGPLPPMKIHCAQLVEGALRSALASESESPRPAAAPGRSANAAPTLSDQLAKASQVKEGTKIVFLEPRATPPTPGPSSKNPG